MLEKLRLASRNGLEATARGKSLPLRPARAAGDEENDESNVWLELSAVESPGNDGQCFGLLGPHDEEVTSEECRQFDHARGSDLPASVWKSTADVGQCR